MKEIINMRWPIIRLILLLFFGKLVCQLHLLVYMFWPETASIKYNLYLSKESTQNITVLYYLYELTGILKDVILNYVLYQAASYFSWKLSKAMVVFFACEVVQFLFYIWNRNTSFWSDNIVYIFMAFILIIIFLPDKPTAKYIQMQSH